MKDPEFMTDFDLVWKSYPRKTAKAVARKAWNRANPDTATVQKMIDALKWQSKTRQWREGRIPHMSTWINQERWDDEPWEPPVAPVPVGHAKQQDANQRFKALIESGMDRASAMAQVSSEMGWTKTVTH